MWDWLLAPLAHDRPHEITDLQQWHARLMFFGWGIVAPLAVITARFFKVLPHQDWPKHLDNQLWWRSHWIGHSLVLVCSLVAIALVYKNTWDSLNFHALIGYTVLLLAFLQATLGLFRGSKGGPTSPQQNGSLSGDHYDMNRRRRLFEILHKSVGYLLLLLSACTITLGLWQVNAPRLMWLGIVIWWTLLVMMFIALQGKGYAIETYQAIWGPDQKHPGNRMAPAGWGMRRVGNKSKLRPTKTRHL